MITESEIPVVVEGDASVVATVTPLFHEEESEAPFDAARDTSAAEEDIEDSSDAASDTSTAAEEEIEYSFDVVSDTSTAAEEEIEYSSDVASDTPAAEEEIEALSDAVSDTAVAEEEGDAASVTEPVTAAVEEAEARADAAPVMPVVLEESEAGSEVAPVMPVVLEGSAADSVEAIVTPVAAMSLPKPACGAVPVVAKEAEKEQKNHTFLMSLMAHPATKAVSVVLFTASLLYLGVAAAGVFHLALTVSTLLTGFGMFATSVGLHAGNRWAASKKAVEEEPVAAVAPVAPGMAA